MIQTTTVDILNYFYNNRTNFLQFGKAAHCSDKAYRDNWEAGVYIQDNLK